MSKLGKRLIRAAKEARNIAQGKAKASSYRIHRSFRLVSKASCFRPKP